MTTEEELMLEFRQGSREAFEEIFQRHREALYGFFRRRLHDPSRAEDLAQETFLAVIRGVARYEPRALVRTYLYGIALNLLAAERRKTTRDGASPGRVSDPPLDADPDAALWVRQAVERACKGSTRKIARKVFPPIRWISSVRCWHFSMTCKTPRNCVRSRPGKCTR